MAAGRFPVGIAGLLLLLGGMARAETLTLNAVSQGWYDQGTPNTDYHDPNNPRYLVGRFQGPYFHNFFVFDLTGVAGKITNATLALNSGTIVGGDETYEMHAVEHPRQSPVRRRQWRRQHLRRPDGWRSYGSGAILGSAPNTPVNIPLSAAFVSAANAAGGPFAIGGGLTTLNLNSTFDQYVFGSGTDPAQLVLTIAPEPASLVLLSMAAASLFALRRRARARRQAAKGRKKGSRKGAKKGKERVTTSVRDLGLPVRFCTSPISCFFATSPLLREHRWFLFLFFPLAPLREPLWILAFASLREPFFRCLLLIPRATR